MVSFIGMFTLVHPFATTWHFPSRGNEKFRGAFLLPPHRTEGERWYVVPKGPRVMVAADAAGCVEGLYFASLRGRQRLRR